MRTPTDAGRIRLRLGAVVAVLVGSAGACGGDAEPGELTTLRVIAGAADGAEYVYDGPDTVAAGPVRVMLANQGTQDHHAQVFRLDDGSTLDDLQAALATGDPAAATEVGTFLGGTGLVSPGEESRADAVLDLDTGRYVLLCFVPDGSGVPHVAHGMLRPFEVTPSDEPPSTPEADGKIELADYTFEAPNSIDGDATLALTNRSATEPHEMVVARLDPGITLDHVATALRAHRPLPARGLGGMQAIMPGATQHLRLDLDPGRYVLVCAVPSPDGTAHYDAGMIQEVTVT